MYPELITRHDIKVFLPPIGGLTVYICTIILFSFSPIDCFFLLIFFLFKKVGNPAFMSDASKELTLRVHDECMYLSFFFFRPFTAITKKCFAFDTGNGSDVFGSDICTCKPYLTYAMEECIRTAQKGRFFKKKLKKLK